MEMHISREQGVDKEDLAGPNISLTVALGLCAAVAHVPVCCIIPLSKTSRLGWGGVGVFCRFCCLTDQIRPVHGCSNTVVFCTFQIYKNQNHPIGSILGNANVWLGGIELMKACNTAAQGPYATNVTSYLIGQVFFIYSPCSLHISGCLAGSGSSAPSLIKIVEWEQSETDYAALRKETTTFSHNFRQLLFSRTGTHLQAFLL